MRGAYIIGEPGAGKSSLARELVAGLDWWPVKTPVPHLAYSLPDAGVVIARQLGAWHHKFPGTDRLSMSVQPRAVEWIASAPAPFVLGEGDRLATSGFLDAMRAACSEWHLVLVDTPAWVALERRAARGSTQSESWVMGRITKTRRLAEEFADHLVRVDGTLSPTEQAAICRGLGILSTD